jgi:hypothetical protein
VSEAALAKSFAALSHPPRLTFLTHLQRDGEAVRVVLEERVGHQLWVRPLDDGEPEPSTPIRVMPRDIVVPFTPLHSVSINTNPTVGDTTGFMLAIPVVEIRRDDTQREIWLRTLNVSEGTSSGRVRAPWGYKVTLEPGAVVVELERVDQMFPPDADGYAPLTNTIWTWMNIGAPPNSATVARYLLAAARRLDGAHRHFQRINLELETFNREAPGPLARSALFEIVGEAEIAIVALNRAVTMAVGFHEVAPIETPVPTRLLAAKRTLTALRDAYEHIEDRAQGKVRKKLDAQARTIFDWSTLFQEGALTYGGDRLELTEVLNLLLDTRSYLLRASAEAKTMLTEQENQLSVD